MGVLIKCFNIVCRLGWECENAFLRRHGGSGDARWHEPLASGIPLCCAFVLYTHRVFVLHVNNVPHDSWGFDFSVIME